MDFNTNLVGSFDKPTFVDSKPTLYESNMKSMFGNVLNQSEILSGYDDVGAERDNDRSFVKEILSSSNSTVDRRHQTIPDCGYSADIEESTTNDLDIMMSRDLQNLSMCETGFGEDLSNSNNCKSAPDLEEDYVNPRTYRKGSVNEKSSRIPAKNILQCVGVRNKQFIRKSKSKSVSKIPVRTPEGSRRKLNCLKRNNSDNLIFDQQHKANNKACHSKRLFSKTKIPKLPEISMQIDHNKQEENRSFNNSLALDSDYTNTPLKTRQDRTKETNNDTGGIIFQSKIPKLPLDNEHTNTPLKTRENRTKETNNDTGGIIFQSKIPKLPDISMATPVFSPENSVQAENRSFNNCTVLDDGYPSPNLQALEKSVDNFQSPRHQTLEKVFDNFQSQSLQKLENAFDNFRVTSSADDSQSNVGDDVRNKDANAWFDEQQSWQDTDVLHTMNHIENDISDYEDDFDNLSIDFCENNHQSSTDFNANQAPRKSLKNATQVRVKVPGNERTSINDKTKTKSNALPKHIIELLHSNDRRLVSLPAVTYMGRTGVDAFNDIENLRGQILEKKKSEGQAKDKIRKMLEGREMKKVSALGIAQGGISKTNQFDHIGDRISTGIGLTISADLKGKLSNLPKRDQERGNTPRKSPGISISVPKRMGIDEVFAQAMDEKCRPDKTCPGYCNRRKGMPNVQLMYFNTNYVKVNFNQEFVTSRYEKASEGIRFSLPGDFKLLETLMPMSYLKQYTKLDPELRDKYTRVFKEFTKVEKEKDKDKQGRRESNRPLAKNQPTKYLNVIDEEKIFPALDSLFANQLGKNNYVNVQTCILAGENMGNITLQHFFGLCAFCERRIWTTYIDQNPKHKATIENIGCRSLLEHLDFQCFIKSFFDDKTLNIPIRLLHLLMSLN